MTPEERAWIDGWKRSSIELPKIRDAELKCLTSERAAELALMLNPWEPAPLRPFGRLIELQRLFKKWRPLETD
ncbi:MAG: hypothetical protein SGI77_15435 [Pirellulaceae bacterium]|nr:hypothetical protein [Pirellulaceae bacterium]